MAQDKMTTVVTATLLATTLAAGVPAVAASGAGQSTAELGAYEIMWVPIRTAEGVYGEGYDVPETVSSAADEGRSYTFERLDADDDGMVQAIEWTEAATVSGMGRRLAEAHFAVVDDDGNGVIGQGEFRAMTGNHYVQALTRAGADDEIPDVVHMPVVIYRLFAS